MKNGSSKRKMSYQLAVSVHTHQWGLKVQIKSDSYLHIKI